MFPELRHERDGVQPEVLGDVGAGGDPPRAGVGTDPGARPDPEAGLTAAPGGAGPEVEGAGPALFRLVRFWARRWVAASAVGAGGQAGTVGAARFQDILVLEAIDAAAARLGEVSVGDVAHELGLDRSGASRMVGEAVRHGLVTRESSAHDGRRATLALTPAGSRLLGGAHAFQQEVFDRLTAAWHAEDAARLAGYLRRLAAEDPAGGERVSDRR
ncbi:MarR family winged helix-turn-helix transcriptional regulator [Spongiactinospora sp. TRM90649]|uniref:MarR family winged helix-turn-helix transcriptional regulator n=1 Tax=Spongiactinospora sp. TRM90649 TaxID=3031114 RepID=UPI0023F83F5E|nr:MarR family winged helix-turn-helix transcriptional regulator [Spongiactinospora sp. TRM90649]MDF5758037.1 MarR family winged helix-turn-helix transcriptional regulator [Spongiactinospora sp. TRM90649]